MFDNNNKLLETTNETITRELQNIVNYGFKLKVEYANYFLNIAKNYMFKKSKDNATKRVGIIGFNVPEELIRACGAKPVWILGGSFDCASYADSMAARDTDPMVKALMGMILSNSFAAFQEIDLIIIPLVSDSMRKIAYILSQQFKTFLIEIPPVKDRASSYQKWENQLEQLTDTISELTGKKPTKDTLLTSSSLVRNAKIQVDRFINNQTRCENLFSTSFYSLVLNTYFMTDDLQEWTNYLEGLNHEIGAISKYDLERLKKAENRPKVIFTGSSILFPNFKIFNLFDDAGLKIIHQETEMSTYLLTVPTIKDKISRNDLFKTITHTYYLRSTSQAFINQKTKLNALMEAISFSKVEGVIYHVIRGQVACDFEFEAVEDLFFKHEIPILRLETDYNYQDLEQLRIRLEAFSEMIKAKHPMKNTAQDQIDLADELLKLRWRQTS